MKQKLFTLIILFSASVQFSSAQTTIWKEDFETGGSNFTMNTTDVINGVTCRGITDWNRWIINKSYKGYIGTITNITNCLGETVAISFGVQDTQNQPANFTGYPQSNYLHVYSPFTEARTGITNANWYYGTSAGDLCGSAGNYFCKMNTGASTAGYSNVTLKFWWMCGAKSVYGQVYYSTDKGNSWTLITTPFSNYTAQKTWKQQSITLPAFDNQADLRFGFMWVNNNGTSAQRAGDASPAFSVDEISLEIPNCAATAGTVSAPRDTVCSGTPAILNVTGGTGGIQWQSSLSATGGFTNISAATSSDLIDIPTQTIYYRVFTGSGNCTDSSAPYKIIVKPSPVADYSFVVTNRHVVFTNQSSGATRYNWDFADGSAQTTEDSPSHDFASDGIYNVCMDAFNGSNCSFRVCKDVAIGNVGIADVTVENKWQIYPQPFKDRIVISGGRAGNAIESVEVYDLLGKEVAATVFSESQKDMLQINLSSLPDGMYFLKIKVKNLEEVHKLIKVN